MELHNYLNPALTIFDGFPTNFYVFLDWAKLQDDLDKFTLKQTYKFTKKYKDNSILRAINYSIADSFDEKELYFLRKAHLDYLGFEKGYSKRIH